MAAQNPCVQLSLADLFPLAGQLRSLQHHRFTVNTRHKLSHAVPAIAPVIRMIGIITTARLSTAAFKASGYDAVRLAAGDLSRGHGNAL